MHDDMTTMNDGLHDGLHDGVHGRGDLPGMMSDRDLRGLGRSRGSDFDRMFLTMMTVHHQGAVEMARTELADGQDPAVKALARTVRATQGKEIAQMRRLLGR